MPTLPVLDAAGLDLRVDADHLAGGVEQRTARVAGVDRRVGLQDVVDREAVGRRDLALKRRDHARRQRPFQVEGVADRVDRVADLGGARVAERERVQGQAVRVDAQHGEIVGGVLADDLRFDGLAFFEADRDLHGVLDDVVVGEDRAVGVDHDAGAGGGSLALRFAAEQERRFTLLHDRGGHERDAGCVFDVDLVRGQSDPGLLRGVGRRDRRGRCFLNRGDRLALAEAARDGEDGDDDAAADEGGDEGDCEDSLHERSRMVGRCEGHLKACQGVPKRTQTDLRPLRAAAGSAARISVSPTRTASTPWAWSVSSCAAEEMPDSDTTIAPGGIADISLAVRSRSTEKSRRSRLLTPMISAPRAAARCELRRVVDLDEHVEAECGGGGVQLCQLLVAERRDDQQHGIGAGGERLVQLVDVDDEVLAQQRQPAGPTREEQVIERAAEVGLLGEDRRGDGAATLIGRDDLLEVGRAVQRPGRRRAPLELGDHADAGCGERCAEAPPSRAGHGVSSATGRSARRRATVSRVSARILSSTVPVAPLTAAPRSGRGAARRPRSLRAPPARGRRRSPRGRPPRLRRWCRRGPRRRSQRRR